MRPLRKPRPGRVTSIIPRLILASNSFCLMKACLPASAVSRTTLAALAALPKAGRSSIETVVTCPKADMVTEALPR